MLLVRDKYNIPRSRDFVLLLLQYLKRERETITTCFTRGRLVKHFPVFCSATKRRIGTVKNQSTVVWS